MTVNVVLLGCLLAPPTSPAVNHSLPDHLARKCSTQETARDWLLTAPIALARLRSGGALAYAAKLPRRVAGAGHACAQHTLPDKSQPTRRR
jgi:hypothetical protein